MAVACLEVAFTDQARALGNSLPSSWPRVTRYVLHALVDYGVARGGFTFNEILVWAYGKKIHKAQRTRLRVFLRLYVRAGVLEAQGNLKKFVPVRYDELTEAQEEALSLLLALKERAFRRYNRGRTYFKGLS